MEVSGNITPKSCSFYRIFHNHPFGGPNILGNPQVMMIMMNLDDSSCFRTSPVSSWPVSRFPFSEPVCFTKMGRKARSLVIPVQLNGQPHHMYHRCDISRVKVWVMGQITTSIACAIGSTWSVEMQQVQALQPPCQV